MYRCPISRRRKTQTTSELTEQRGSNLTPSPADPDVATDVNLCGPAAKMQRAGAELMDAAGGLCYRLVLILIRVIGRAVSGLFASRTNRYASNACEGSVEGRTGLVLRGVFVFEVSGLIWSTCFSARERGITCRIQEDLGGCSGSDQTSRSPPVFGPHCLDLGGLSVPVLPSWAQGMQRRRKARVDSLDRSS